MRNQFLNNASGRVVDWLSALYNHTEMQELRADLPGFLNVMTGNWLLNGREDKKISVAGMLPYTTLATVGFAATAFLTGGASIFFPLLVFALAHPVIGYGNALNEMRKEAGFELPSLTGDETTRKLASFWDQVAGNERLVQRGLPAKNFNDIAPGAAAFTAGSMACLGLMMGAGVIVPSFIVAGPLGVVGATYFMGAWPVLGTMGTAALGGITFAGASISTAAISAARQVAKFDRAHSLPPPSPPN